MKVAISAEDNLFRLNRILDESWATKYPGASWHPLFKEYMEPDFEVVTADVALDHVRQGFWDAKNIFVIQHGGDIVAYKLIKKGAFPLALTCFESPIYIGEFYKKVSDIAPDFKHRIIFSGLHKKYRAEIGVNYQVTFPSFFLNDINKYVFPWRERERMVAVIGNKYLIPSCCPSQLSLKEWLWWLRKTLAQFIHQSYPSGSFPVKNIQLQDIRLACIAYFMEHGLLDLYGKGWDSLRNLPPGWQRKLTPLLKINPARSCENKLETIKSYKYGLCIENAKFPGYVTEKIIDCLVAGVIPVYMGAPDIEKFIPKYCFVDFREYKNMDDLFLYLQSMQENEANEIITCGQKFLQSEKGMLYSYEGFARFMADIVREEYENLT